MTHVRSFQTSTHAAFSQHILNELAAARVCLLNPQKKAEYDRQLQAKLTTPPPPPVMESPIVVEESNIPDMGFASTYKKHKKPTPSWMPWVLPLLGLVVAVVLIVLIAEQGRDEQRVAKASVASKPLSPAHPKVDPKKETPKPAQQVEPKGEVGLPRDAVLIFTFEEDSLVRREGKLYVRDLSGNGNDGLVSGTNWGRDELVRVCQSLGETDYVECVNKENLNPTSFTICAWVKVRSWQRLQSIGYIVSKEDWEGGGQRGYVLRGEPPNGIAELSVSAGNWRKVFSDMRLELARWYHLVGRCDGNQLAIFIDGVRHGTTRINQPLAHSPFNLRIGCGNYRHRKNLRWP